MSSDAHQAVPPPLRPSVFISYASADRAAVRALRDTLAAGGLEVWLDEDELGGGEAWDTKIRNQIRSCTYFMPVISASTEVRREGYFRREWRLAVERTLDLADDVMFLVPVVIDDTRDKGARVPDKFFSVQWLRVPGGQATAALRELAGKLALGEAAAIHPPAPAVRAASQPAGKKTRKPESAPPPFPPVPPFPEPGHRPRFCYDIILWGGHMVHALWMRLPTLVRIVASIVIVFNIIAWIFRDHDRPVTTKAEKAALAADLAKTIGAAVSASETDGESAGTKKIKSLVGAATEALQTGRPLALVNFSGSTDEATTYANSLFGHLFKLLQQNADGKVSVSPIPLDADSDDDEALARGTRLKSRYVLTGFAQPPAPGQPLTFIARLYDVKQRTLVWTDTYEAAQTDAAAAAQLLADAMQQRALTAAKP